MASPSTSPPAGRDDAELPRIFVGIVFLEVIVIAGLYWMGRYFG